MTGTRVRAERREVAINRQRILDAAERVFADEGFEAPLQRVADEAGVGIATLFRRFPTREDLYRALYDAGVARIDAILERAIAENADGWGRIETFLREGMKLVFDMPVLPGAMRRVATHDPDYRPAERWAEPIGSSVHLAQREGTLRADVTGYDIVTFVFSFNGFAYQPEPMRSEFGERVLTIVLDGLRVGSTTRLRQLTPFAPEEFHLGSHGAHAS